MASNKAVAAAFFGMLLTVAIVLVLHQQESISTLAEAKESVAVTSTEGVDAVVAENSEFMPPKPADSMLADLEGQPQSAAGMPPVIEKMPPVQSLAKKTIKKVAQAKTIKKVAKKKGFRAKVSKKAWNKPKDILGKWPAPLPEHKLDMNKAAQRPDVMPEAQRMAKTLTGPPGLKEPFKSTYEEMELTPGVVDSTHVVDIKTPGRDSKIRKLVLPNGMKVLITSDPQLPQSASGLANLDGSWQNPEQSQGLAHFIEHMLFMGTEQHPKPSSFDTFLAASGAQISNAQTGSQMTQFAFSSSHEAFPEALDRFADLFTAPLFDTKSLHKEIHAVNQEYEMHKDDDTWRQLFLQKATANPEHPWSRFSIGTLNTLGGVDHKEIKKMFETHYSANLMGAAVYTKLPLDEAETVVRDRLGRIPNRKLKVEHFTMPILDPKREGKVIWQKSKTTQHSLTLQWELPRSLTQEDIHGKRHRLSKVRPDRLIGQVLNYMGENSLFHKLQTEGLAQSFAAYQNDQGLDNSLFEIDVNLTPKGFKNWDTAIEMVFQAIAALKKEGIPEHVFTTIHTSDKNTWQWAWRDGDVFDKAMDVCGDVLQTYHWESYPYVDNILQEYDSKPAMDLLEVLKPETMHVYGLAPEFPAGTEHAKLNIEHFYKSEWKQVDFTAMQKARWSLALPAEFVQIPPANPYLPKHLAVTKDLETPPVYPALPTPHIVLNKEGQKVFLWQDKVFGDPYVMGHMTMKTDKALTNDLGVDVDVGLSLLMTCVNHAILPKLVPFAEAAISASIDAGSGTNLELSFSATNTEPEHYQAAITQLAGYARKIADGKLSDFVDQKTFDMLQTSTQHALENKVKSSPIGNAIIAMHQNLLAHNYPITEQLAAVKKATFKSVAAIGPKLFKKAFFEGFFSGQITKEQTLDTWSKVMDMLDAKNIPALDSKSMLHDQMRILKNEPTFVKTSGPTSGNGAVLFIDAGGLDCKEREALSVLYKAMPPAFYADLRSKQQTGYLVETDSSVFISHHDVLLFLVQSTLYKPGDLVGRFDTFITKALKDLQSGKSKIMDGKNFETIRGAKLAAFKTPNSNVGSVTSLLRTLLSNYDADWSAMSKKKKIIEELTHNDVVAVAKKILGAHNKKKMAIGYTPKDVEADDFPKDYVAFDPKKNNKFATKPKFACAVDVPTLAKTIDETKSTKASASSDAHKDASTEDDEKDGNVDNTSVDTGSHATAAKAAVVKPEEEVQVPAEPETEKVEPVSEEDLVSDSAEAQGALMAALKISSENVEEDKPNVHYYPAGSN